MKAPSRMINSIGLAMRVGAALAIVFLPLGAARSEAAGLQEGTLQAWDAYVRSVNATVAEHATGDGTFLWVDESPELGRRVRAGEVLVASHDLQKVLGGLIHHWVGAMFLPDVTIEEVTRVLDDYDRYAEFYRPIVVKSKLLGRTDDYEKVTMMMMQKAFGVTAAVETDDEIRIIQLDADRICSLSDSVRVQEVVNYGRPDERLLPEGQGQVSYGVRLESHGSNSATAACTSKWKRSL